MISHSSPHPGSTPRGWGRPSAVALLSLALAYGLGCSASADSKDPFPRGLGGPPGSAGVGVGGAMTGVGGPSTGGGTFLNLGGGATLGPSGGGDASCAATSQTTEQVTVEVPIYEYRPVALYLMQDRSSSMVGVGGDPQSWSQANGAVGAFVTDPASAGLDVGLGFFPPTTTNAGACDGSDCSVPVVPFGPLPANAQPVINAMNSATPPAFPPLFTPTECALRGATARCAAYQAQTQVQCVVVLVSDGAPTVCDTSTGTLVQVAADALASWSVLTFTVGMTGADFGVLNAIATAGGSDCDPNGPDSACDVRGGQASFIAALNLIRQTVTRVETRIETTKVDCEWVIPPAPNGEAFDKEKVNVQFGTAATPPQQVAQVPSRADCAAFGGGWFYDDPSNPTRVQVCDETCAAITTTVNVKVDVLFGCQTVVAVLM